MKLSHVNRRGQIAAVGLAALVTGLGSAGLSSPNAAAASKNFPTSHTLTLSFLQDPGQPPDPDVYYAGEGLLLTRNLYQGLVQYQPGTATKKIIPSLATSWTVSADGLTYTFDLRKGVKFHDGTPFTSAAIEPSFARRAAVNGGPAYTVSDVASVKPEGPNKVAIKLKTRNSAFLDFLAAPYGPVMESPTALKAHAGSNHDQTYLQTHDIGTGPYTLTQAKVGVSYQLQAFSGYWGPKPYYTTVNLPVIDNLSTQEIEFNTGKLAGILHDLTTTAATQYQESKKVRFYKLPVLENDTVFVNENKGMFTNQATRTAFLQAINIPSIVASVFPGGQAKIPPQIMAANLLPTQYARQTITFDPSKLQKMVSKLPSAERNITISYDTGAPDDQLIAEDIAAQVKSYGVNAKVVGEQTSTIYGNIGSVKYAKGLTSPNVLVDYLWPDADNPYTWTHILYEPTGGLEYESCNAPGTIAPDAQALTTGSLADYNQVATAVEQSGCWLNVADRNDLMVFQPWLQGVAQAHVVAAPEALLLNDLYPG
jgi:peptide/nickel transport system substrate-binding protein